jgi:hypothetical protein
MPLLRIETLAASTGDPQLYAEAALEGRSVEDQPVIGLTATTHKSAPS